MIAQAYFERINGARNIRRFRRITIIEGTTLTRIGGVLKLEWGTIGRPGAGRVTQTADGQSLQDKVLSLAALYNRRGFLIKAFDGPNTLRVAIEAGQRSLGLIAGTGQSINSLFYDIPTFEAVIGPHAADDRRRLALLRDYLDPGLTTVKLDDSVAQPCLPGLFETIEIKAQLRGVVRSLVDRLFPYDPLAKIATAKALSTPDYILGDNVVQFPLPSSTGDMPLYRLLHRQPELADLIYRLTDGDIRTVGALMTLQPVQLQARFAASDDEIDALVGAVNGLCLRPGARATPPKRRERTA